MMRSVVQLRGIVEVPNDVPTELSLPVGGTVEGELETRSLEELSFTDAAARSRQVNLLPPSGYVL